MRAALDGTIEFEQHQLKVCSWRRDTVERTAAGLDGVLSVDLGMRGRVIVQKGVLRGESEEGLKAKVAEVLATLDGQMHTLVIGDGQEFENLRVDVFEISNKDYSGRGVGCDFEIKYTQLRSS